MTECVVAVDVGNSAVKLCVRRDLGEQCRDPEAAANDGGAAAIVNHAVGLDRSDWDRSVIDWVRNQLGCHNAQWRIASVQRSAADRLCAAIASAEPSAAVHRVSHRDVPMRPQVDYPDQLGIDRLLAAHAAHQRFGKPLVVVDAGSAVTIDWVDSDGDFCGGAILPGLALQLAALANETDALPQIELRMAGPLGRPAKNTADAIRLGVVTGIVATIERLANEFARIAETEPAESHLILTGGDAPLISSHLGRPHRLAENLVCRGLLDLPRSVFDATNPSEQLD